MSLQDNAGNALLAAASSTGMVNFLSTADTIISIVVGCLSAVGIVYSIIWHKVRIAKEKKANEQSKRDSS